MSLVIAEIVHGVVSNLIRSQRPESVFVPEGATTTRSFVWMSGRNDTVVT